MKKNKETKLRLDLFRMGWFCAQETMDQLYQSNFSDISKSIAELSFMGITFKPDKYTASLQDGGEVVCKTKCETKTIESIQAPDLAQVPEWVISTNYFYTGVMTFNSTINLIITPSLLLTLYAEEPDALAGCFTTTYTLTYGNIFYKFRVPEEKALGGSSLIEDSILLFEDSTYYDIKKRFLDDLSRSILCLLQELNQDFKTVEEKIKKNKKEQSKPKKKTPVDLDTLLYSLAEKL